MTRISTRPCSFRTSEMLRQGGVHPVLARLYAARGQNTSVTSFSADGVFSDGTTYQMATITGDLTSGYTATLTVGIAA